MIRVSTIATLALLIPAALAQEPASRPAAYTVHEWGTFTSFQGSDGIVLEGLHHEEESLPGFVHDLGGLTETGRVTAGLKFPASRVTQKMETPVLYFHTDEARRVRVSVLFQSGLITQFYPMPELVSPPLSELEALIARSPVDLSKIDWSRIEWDVELVPQGGTPPPEIQVVDRDDPWAEARRVDAAYVRSGAESEHYLFYRGLGRCGMPLRVLSDGSGSVLHNDSEFEVPFAIAMRVEAGGRGTFEVLGPIDAGARVVLGVDAVVDLRGPRSMRGGMHVAVQRALVAQGLNQDEARAMVATWSRQWFLTPGRRVLWCVPRPIVDRTLPLTITPKPAELVRVLVGRLEFLTPTAEDLLERALEARLAEDATTRHDAERVLSDLDRFLEPRVRRAWARTESARVRASAEEVLATLRDR